MRGTLHMVPTVDVRWTSAGRSSGVWDGGGVSGSLHDATCERAPTAIETVFRGTESLARAALIGTTTQTHAHLVMYAATHGLICRGPGDDTYIAAAEWAGETPRLPKSGPDEPR